MKKRNKPRNQYSVKQLAESVRFREYRDILCAQLESEAVYTIAETENIINTFLKKERKN